MPESDSCQKLASLWKIWLLNCPSFDLLTFFKITVNCTFVIVLGSLLWNIFFYFITVIKTELRAKIRKSFMVIKDYIYNTFMEESSWILWVYIKLYFGKWFFFFLEMVKPMNNLSGYKNAVVSTTTPRFIPPSRVLSTTSMPRVPFTTVGFTRSNVQNSQWDQTLSERNGRFNKPAPQCIHWNNPKHRLDFPCRFWHPREECRYDFTVLLHNLSHSVRLIRIHLNKIYSISNEMWFISKIEIKMITFCRYFPNCTNTADECGFAHPFCGDFCHCPKDRRDPQMNHRIADEKHYGTLYRLKW